MSAAPTPITSRDEQLWDAFLVAKDKAMASGTIADGLACKRAWSAFLNSSTQTTSAIVLAFEARR